MAGCTVDPCLRACLLRTKCASDLYEATDVETCAVVRANLILLQILMFIDIFEMQRLWKIVEFSMQCNVYSDIVFILE